MFGKVYLYGLYDASDRISSVRYIGITGSPKTRLIDHNRIIGKTQKHDWVRSVLARGGRIEMIIIGEFPSMAEARVAEDKMVKIVQGSVFNMALRDKSIPVISLPNESFPFRTTSAMILVMLAAISMLYLSESGPRDVSLGVTLIAGLVSSLSATIIACWPQKGSA